jgi:hypothetical protein
MSTATAPAHATAECAIPTDQLADTDPSTIDAELIRLEHLYAGLGERIRRERRSGRRVAELTDQLHLAGEGIDRLESEHDRRRWPRAFKVVTEGGGGHIHSTMACRTCFPTTQFVRLPQASGLSADEVAELAGERACTVCYPNAPVQKRCRLETVSEAAARAAREAREAKARDARLRAAAAAITNPDSTPLVEDPSDRHPEVIKTERQAVSAYTWAVAEAEMYERYVADGTTPPGWQEPERWATLARAQAAKQRDLARRCLAALAWKQGVDADELAASLEKKVQVKRRQLRK